MAAKSQGETYQHRIRARYTGGPDYYREAPDDPKEAGKLLRKARETIELGGCGGEAAIERRRVVGPWEAAGEVARIEPKAKT